MICYKVVCDHREWKKVSEEEMLNQQDPIKAAQPRDGSAPDPILTISSISSISTNYKILRVGSTEQGQLMRFYSYAVKTNKQKK